MAKFDAPMSLVDQNLCVRGVKGFRVADCSMVPTFQRGHTQMPGISNLPDLACCRIM